MELRRVDPQHGQIGVRIVSDDVRVRAAPVREHDFDSFGAVDDVAVRQHKSVGSDDEPRTAAGMFAISPAHLDVHHRGADLVCGTDHRPGIGIQQRVLFMRCGRRR